MILTVKVIPRAKMQEVKELAPACLKVHVAAPAQDNKANKALIEILAEYYKVKQKQITIIKGECSRNKVVEINAR